MDLSSLLEILSPLSEAQAYLSEFDGLPDTERDNRHLNVADLVFPLTFGDDATIKISPTFSQFSETTWSTNCQLAPRVIVTPRSVRDVGKALALCRFLDIKFSVRGGGHLSNPGFNSNENGVVISMCKFKDITMSEDRSTAEIGFGLTWLEVYRALEPYGLTVTGGRVPSVGVAGLLLGGGLSFQNGEHGLSCSGVVEYEVVLADSTVIRANAEENSDLFWALKGGGSNFGIVTRAKMSTVSNQVWAEGRLYSPTVNESLLHAITQYHEASEKDNKSSLILQSNHEVTIVVFFYCAPTETRPSVFSCFDDIPFLTRIVEPGSRTVYDVVNGFASINDVPRKSHDMRTMSSLPDIAVYKAAEETRLQQVEAIKNIPGAHITMVIQPISSHTITACNAKGGTPLGLEPQSHQWFLVLSDWTNPEDEATMREASRKIVDRAETAARQNGTFLRFKYSNYASRDQDPLAGYGEENVRRLRDVARRVDPGGVFQTLQFGGWLLYR